MNRLRLVALATALVSVTGLAGLGSADDYGSPKATKRKHVTAGPALDYRTIKGLSQPTYKTVREEALVKMADGVHVYAEVVRPTTPGRYGVILELSPYHGTLADRSGTRVFPGPEDDDGNKTGLAGYFAPRGYAVVFADLRGTGRSEGCLDHMGPKDQSDAKEIVEWAARQPWSNGRVGMTGHSYVGSTPQMAAAQNPRGLVTIVPSAGLASMYHHEFQDGVPYNLQWVGPLEAYEQLAIERHLPGGDNFGNGMQYFGCGLPQSAAVTGEAYFSGAYTPWHAERDFRAGVTAWKGAVFAVHGVNDAAARIPALDWFHARRGRPGDKAWIGQWPHNPTDRDEQWTYALHAWFDRHLLGRKVQTGPPVEVFLNNETVLTAKAWPPPPTRTVLFHPSANGAMGTQPDEAADAQYVANPASSDPARQAGLVFDTDPLPNGLLIAGIPQMRYTVTVNGSRIHLMATLYHVDETDSAERISQAGFAIQPELRAGVDRPAPVVPGQKMKINLIGMAQARYLAPGHRLRLVLSSSDQDKVPTFAAGAVVTVHTGGEDGTVLKLPVLDAAPLYADPNA